MELTEKQMYQVEGGVSWKIVAGIGTAIVYLIGFFSGFTNPTRCSN